MDIYYEVFGEGFPIVCLHGNGEDHHIFDQLKASFSHDYQFIMIDSRYHGQSVQTGEFSYHQMCKDVKAVVDELGLFHYDVIGFSDGAIIALNLAMQDDRLQHLVCIGANTSPQMIKPFYRFTFMLQMICLLPFCIYNSQARKQLKFIRLMLKEPHTSYQSLQCIKIPVLILAGEYDMIKAEDTKNIAQALPYSVMKIIKGGNHFLLRDTFQKTFNEINLFIQACHQED